MSTYFTSDHEWITVDGQIATVGITSHAAEAMGDVVFVDIQEVGSSVDAGAAAGVVESVKAASDIYAPVSGKIVEVNSRVADEPELVSKEPETAGWLFKVELADPSQLSGLMDRQAYDAHVASS